LYCSYYSDIERKASIFANLYRQLILSVAQAKFIHNVGVSIRQIGNDHVIIAQPSENLLRDLPSARQAISTNRCQTGFRASGLYHLLNDFYSFLVPLTSFRPSFCKLTSDRANNKAAEPFPFRPR